MKKFHSGLAYLDAFLTSIVIGSLIIIVYIMIFPIIAYEILKPRLKLWYLRKNDCSCVSYIVCDSLVINETDFCPYHRIKKLKRFIKQEVKNGKSPAIFLTDKNPCLRKLAKRYI